jgi:hypothetical protein
MDSRLYDSALSITAGLVRFVEVSETHLRNELHTGQENILSMLILGQPNLAIWLLSKEAMPAHDGMNR